MAVETRARATSERKEKPLRHGAAMVLEPLRKEAQMDVDSEPRDKPLSSYDESETNTDVHLRPWILCTRRLAVPPQNGRADTAT